MRDEQAYKKLFYHFYHSIHQFALAVVKINEVAEEIVSDAMMKLWDAGNKLAQIEKLDAYLFILVKNACFTYLNKKKISNNAVGEIEDDAAIDYSTPQQILEQSEVVTKINDCVNKLSPQCVMVYKLVKEEGFSYKKVSSILEISQNTIETHMRIALKKIRASLATYLSEKN